MEAKPRQPRDPMGASQAQVQQRKQRRGPHEEVKKGNHNYFCLLPILIQRFLEAQNPSLGDLQIHLLLR